MLCILLWHNISNYVWRSLGWSCARWSTRLHRVTIPLLLCRRVIVFDGRWLTQRRDTVASSDIGVTIFRLWSAFSRLRSWIQLSFVQVGQCCWHCDVLEHNLLLCKAIINALGHHSLLELGAYPGLIPKHLLFDLILSFNLSLSYSLLILLFL